MNWYCPYQCTLYLAYPGNHLRTNAEYARYSLACGQPSQNLWANVSRTSFIFRVSNLFHTEYTQARNTMTPTSIAIEQPSTTWITSNPSGERSRYSPFTAEVDTFPVSIDQFPVLVGSDPVLHSIWFIRDALWFPHMDISYSPQFLYDCPFPWCDLKLIER